MEKKNKLYSTKRQIKRPLCLIATAFTGVTALAVPFYESFLRFQPGYIRLSLIAVVMLGLVVPAMLLSFWALRGRRIVPAAVILLCSSAAAVVTVCFGMEFMRIPVCSLDNTSPSVTAQILDWDVTDYGTKYLVRTQRGSQLPTGIKARVYSFTEPVGEIGDIIAIKAPIRTEVSADELGRRVFFYAYPGDTPMTLIEEKTTAREKLLAQTEKLYADPVEGIIQGVLFGEKSNLEKPIKELLDGAGLMHLMAVSGIHISLFTAVCVKLFSFLRFPKRWTLPLSLAPVWCYVALAQFSPSAVRAGIMASVAALGWVVSREKDDLTSLSAAAIFILMFDPFAVCSVSFRLSFTIILGIILCAKPISRLLLAANPISFIMAKAGSFSQNIIRSIVSVISATAAAGVFSAPILLEVFGSVPLWSIAAAVPALWAAPFLMLAAIISTAAGLLYDVFGGGLLLLTVKVSVGIAGLFARWILLVGKAVSLLPFAKFYSNSAYMTAACWIIVVVIILTVYKFNDLTIRQQKRRFLCFGCCAVFLLSSVSLAQGIFTAGKLEVYRTDNAFVLVRDEQAAVVGDVCSSYEADKIGNILYSEGVQELDLFFCDAVNCDKSSGVDILLEKFPTKAAFVPQGRYFTYIQKAVGKEKMHSEEDVDISLLGEVRIINGNGSAEIFVKDKKLLKN